MKIARFKIEITPVKKQGSWNGSKHEFRNDALKKDLVSIVDTEVNETILECYLIRETRFDLYKNIRKEQLTQIEKIKKFLSENIFKSNLELSQIFNQYSF